MNVKLTLYHFKELLKNGFTLDMVFLLKLVEEGHGLKEACNGNVKLEMLYQILIKIHIFLKWKINTKWEEK